MQKDKQRGKNDHKDSDTRDYHSDTQQPKRDKWNTKTQKSNSDGYYGHSGIKGDKKCKTITKRPQMTTNKHNLKIMTDTVPTVI